MTRTISITKKASKIELNGQKAKIVAILIKTPVVEFDQLRKATSRTMTAKRLRSHVRQLAAEKIVSVKRAA